jgi:hypothetical protein
MNFPAGYDHVMSVAAIDESSRVAGFSTRNDAVDIAAPGVDVLSLGTFGDYTYLSGTSMATPHVAGVAALVWSQFRDRSPTDIEQALMLSALDLESPGRDPLTGHGLVDAVAAAIYLEGSVPSPPPPPVSCGAGESLMQVSLTTDYSALDQNQLYLYDDGAPDEEYIWIMTLNQLENNSAYAGDTCLDLASKCYKFFFFDEAGDGFLQGGLTLSLNGGVVLQISPGDGGYIYEEGRSKTYWYQEFGSCTGAY